jgi:hypothetical protein
MAITIQTSQAPDAKPVGVSKTLSTVWQVLIDVPQYEVPEQIFGGTTFIVPGAAEIITPLIASNTSSSPATLSVRVFRVSTNSYYTIINNILIQPNDLITIPLNGQILHTDDLLEARSNIADVIDVHISYTVGQPEQDDVQG